MSARPLLCGCTPERPCFEHAPAPKPRCKKCGGDGFTFGVAFIGGELIDDLVDCPVCKPPIPVQLADPETETYGCDCCGKRSDDPMPCHERYGSTDFFYCLGCGEDWKRDGAEVVRVDDRRNP